MTSAPAPRDERGETGYLLAGFGQGPGNVLTAFWGVAFLALAAIDGTCHPSNGVSSGADGARCTDEDTWDETLWLSLNGTFCREGDDLFGVIRYTHDTAKPGCGAAFTAYREVKPFTCNCTGVGNVHAFMGGWLRVGLVVIFPATIVALIVAITSPVVGTFLDFSTNRKSIWMVMWVVNTVAIAGMAVLGHDYLWVVGGFFFLFANFTGGFALLLRQSYLPDLAPGDQSSCSEPGGPALQPLPAARGAEGRPHEADTHALTRTPRPTLAHHAPTQLAMSMPMPLVTRFDHWMTRRRAVGRRRVTGSAGRPFHSIGDGCASVVRHHCEHSPGHRQG